MGISGGLLVFTTPNGKRVLLEELDKAIEFFWRSTYPEITDFSLEKYPRFLSQNALRGAVTWFWLAWQQHRDLGFTNKAFIPLVMRSTNISFVSAKTDTKDALGRPGIHDWYLLVCGILTGNRDVMEQCARDSESELLKSSKKRDQPFEALAGILRSRILNDGINEKRHLARLERSLQTGPDLCPTTSLVRAFVNRDYKVLNRLVTAGSMRHWSERFLRVHMRTPQSPESVITGESETEVVINLIHKDPFAFWAYPEAAFAKLATMDGATITHDDFWLPQELINSGPASSVGSTISREAVGNTEPVVRNVHRSSASVARKKANAKRAKEKRA